MSSFGTISIARPTFGKPETETPFRIAVLADFSGRANRGLQAASDELGARRPIAIGFDSLDEALASFSASLVLPIDGGAAQANLQFGELDDFHPDPIVRQVDLLDDRRDDRDAATALMREILHHRDYQALEAAWRGVEWLLRRTNKSKSMQVLLLDASLAELAADLNADDDLAGSALYRWLVAQPAEKSLAVPWGALVANYTFAVSAEHAQVLGRMASVAAHAGAPLFADGSLAVLDEAFDPGPDALAAWDELRALPAAAYLGLALPRFLLRPPFGAGYKSAEAFDFEEFSGQNSDYLWGQAALAGAGLLVASFTAHGWDFRPGAELRLDGMPNHPGKDADGEPVVVTCEARFASSVAERATKLGMMPILSVRGRDAIELGRIRSLAAESPDLAGPWQQAAGVAAPVGTPRPGGSSVSMIGGAVTQPGPSRAPGKSVTSAKPKSAENDDDANAGKEADAADSATATDDEPAFALPDFETPAADAGDTSAEDELAALMAGLENDNAAAPAEPNAAGPSAEDELAALMASLESDVPAAEDAPSEAASADDELAALMAGLEADVPQAENEPQTPGENEPQLSNEDDELAALMAGLEADVPQVANEPQTPGENEPQPSNESDDATMDDELARMMAELDQPADEPPADAAESAAPAESSPAVEPDNLDDELAAMMASLEAEAPAEEPAVEEPAAEEFPPDASASEVVQEVEINQPIYAENAVDDTMTDESTIADESNPPSAEPDLELAIRNADQATNFGGPGSGSPPILDFRALLEPIPGDDPAGGSVPYVVRENLEQWRKDIDPALFAEDDPTRPPEEIHADWQAIIDLSQQTMREKSKNLLIAARLLEALTQKYGFAGLRDGLHLMRLMIDVAWNRLDPPLDEDELEVRAAPFNWLDDPDRGACFPHTVRKTAIVRNGQNGYGWLAWQQAGDAREGVSPEEVERAVFGATREACQATVENLTQSLLELQHLTRSLNDKLGHEAPGFTALRPAIEDSLGLAKQVLQRKGAAPAGAPAEVEEVAADGTVRVVVERPKLSTRDDVYRQLAEAAEALQKIEPHSPVPFLIHRAVELGALPFPQLMAALIRDSNVLAEMNRELGIKQEG